MMIKELKKYTSKDIRYTHVCFTYLYLMGDQVSFHIILDHVSTLEKSSTRDLDF